MPFAPAAQMLAHFTPVATSEPTARRLTERAGAAYEAVQTAEAVTIREELPAVPAGPAVQQLSVDGAMVPLVHGEWAEVKTLALGTVQERVWERDHWQVHATDLSYFSRLTDRETFADQALVELHRRGTETAGTVCAVVDGAEWEQRFIDLHRSDAVRIPGTRLRVFPHAAEHVSKAAHAVYGPGTMAATTWLETQVHPLKQGDPQKVLAALRALEGEIPVEKSAEQRQTIRTTLAESVAYLEKRIEQIQYATFQRQGYPIGSGSVESANKLVVEARLKGAGMRWSRGQVNPMLALRTIAWSDRWEEAWPQISAQVRQEGRDRSQARRVERQAQETVAADRAYPAAEPVPEEAPPPSAATQEPAAAASSQEHDPDTEPGKKRWRPPANHPWRGWSLTSQRTAPGPARASAER